MAQDEGKQEEENFNFTDEGEALGYSSLHQARVLAMRTVDTPQSNRATAPGGQASIVLLLPAWLPS